MESRSINELNYEQVQDIINKKTPMNAIFIDVRGPDEYSAGHIPGAYNVPLDTVDSAFKSSSADFESSYKFKKPTPNDKNSNIILYCQKGMRSRKAAKILQDIGYTENLLLYPNGYGEYGQK
ncbi:hypothetical protein BB561_001480 [Smittium simulii]|uniref:Rhodanese domain-containing protein n=1 Tax=Smittium simulii TaxID=133385 RepID=A0A2T9YUF1_9FUNG|nr:hypothetical protein BB561_001480 [Smittium simulii]